LTASRSAGDTSTAGGAISVLFAAADEDEEAAGGPPVPRRASGLNEPLKWPANMSPFAVGLGGADGNIPTEEDVTAAEDDATTAAPPTPTNGE